MIIIIVTAVETSNLTNESRPHPISFSPHCLRIHFSSGLIYHFLKYNFPEMLLLNIILGLSDVYFELLKAHRSIIFFLEKSAHFKGMFCSHTTIAASYVTRKSCSYYSGHNNASMKLNVTISILLHNAKPNLCYEISGKSQRHE
jgi:hypothetical protein